MFCKHCGNEIESTESNFCPKCGKLVNEEKSTQTIKKRSNLSIPLCLDIIPKMNL